MSLPDAITIQSDRKPSHGRYNVRLMQGEKVLLTARVNPHKSDEIDDVILRAKEQFPGLNGEANQIRDHLLNLSAVTKREPKVSTDRPTICVSGRQMREYVADSLKALAAVNSPARLYQQNRKIVRVAKDERGHHTIATVDADYMRGELARAANFYAMSENGGEIDVVPPSEVVRDILSRDISHELGLLECEPLPRLVGVVETPVMRLDGSILCEHGYDAATSLYYAPRTGFVFHPVPENPSAAQVQDSLALLNEAIGQFPYETDVDYCHTVAALITPAVRAAAGLAPICICDAPQAGTGKSLLMSLIHMIHTGESGHMVSCPEHDEEWRKLITSMLIEGRAIIILDNLDRPLSAGSLARAITSVTWVDRLLGKNDTTASPNLATWFCTGNNVAVGGDMARRVYRIRLNARTSKPWNDGREFAHPNLLEWVADNRGVLVSAILTICRGWFAGGRIDFAPPRLGSFEGWSALVGNILANAGIRGFLENLDEMYEAADDDSPQWERFLSSLHAKFASGNFTVKVVEEAIPSDEGIRDALPDALATHVERFAGQFGPQFRVSEPGKFKIRLGKAMKQRIQRRYGEGMYLSSEMDSHTKSSTWRVQIGGSAGSGGSVSNPTNLGET